MSDHKTYDTEAVVDALMSDTNRNARDSFIDAVDMDRVVAALLRLTMEISTLRDRVDAHESLAAKGQPYSQADVDDYLPTPEEEKTRAAKRQQLISRLVRDLTA